jgi:tRNA pseudouridine(55) synthase
MLFFEKRVGETPLQMLDRLRLEKPEFKNSKLSYAGRLDPMASGKMIVLVDEENKDYKKYLGYDKKYEATFLFGLETDTKDILGFITKIDLDQDFDQEKIKNKIADFKKIKKQKYPWFSSITVNGIKLFDHFKRGNLDIERPVRDAEIKSSEILGFEKVSIEKLEEYILDNIKKIEGDFRQEETIEKWEDFFEQNRGKEFLTVKVKLLVSTGTYIRNLTENLEYSSTLLKLHRTKIIT